VTKWLQNRSPRLTFRATLRVVGRTPPTRRGFKPEIDLETLRQIAVRCPAPPAQRMRVPLKIGVQVGGAVLVRKPPRGPKVKLYLSCTCHCFKVSDLRPACFDSRRVGRALLDPTGALAIFLGGCQIFSRRRGASEFFVGAAAACYC
jgi:hypothetical protein